MFKDDMKIDLDTFLELEEFAQLITLEGVELRGQVIKYTAEKSQRLAMQYGGLHGDFVQVYFATDEYLAAGKALPVQGQWVLLDGRRYDVVSCEDQQGLTRLVLSAYRQTVRFRGEENV